MAIGDVDLKRFHKLSIVMCPIFDYKECHSDFTYHLPWILRPDSRTVALGQWTDYDPKIDYLVHDEEGQLDQLFWFLIEYFFQLHDTQFTYTHERSEIDFTRNDNQFSARF